MDENSYKIFSRKNKLWVSENLKKPSEPIEKNDFLSSTSFFVGYIFRSLNY